MKKNGFVFVETIIAIVVLTSSLLLLYSSFNKILQQEKTRVYYDDISYIYRSHYIKEHIKDLNFLAITNELADEEKYFVTVGLEYNNLFLGYDYARNYTSKLFNDFEVNQIVIIKENKIEELKQCTLECSSDANCEGYENCNNMYINLSEEFINYLKTIFVDVSGTFIDASGPYILVVEYNTCTGSNGNDNCKRYYSWIGV